VDDSGKKAGRSRHSTAAPVSRASSHLQQLEIACQVEELAETLYRGLARKFGDGGPIAAVFNQLADEEAQHGLRIRMLRSQVSKRPMDFRGELGLSGLEALLEEARTLEQLFRSPDFRPTSAEAKQFMIELEHRFYEAHAQVMLRSENQALREFFAALARQDQAHAKLLDSME
jgi:rubrerythrin